MRPRAEDDATTDLDEQPVSDDRATQYRDWADRLRAKRVTAKQRIQGTPNEVPPTYWDSESVFRDHECPVDEEVPILLAVFGIVGEPSPHQVETEFRRLAKMHHPDRHIGADEPTRAFHLDQMRRINEAYSRLRQLQLA